MLSKGEGGDSTYPKKQKYLKQPKNDPSLFLPCGVTPPP